MKKEDKVIPLWLAKEIHKLSYKKNVELIDSEYTWYEKHDCWGLVKTLRRNEELPVYGFYKAFDVAELGELLERPDITMTNFKMPYSLNPPYRISLNKLEEFGTKGEQIHYEQEHTEAVARGKMLLYLLKNNLL